MSRLKRSEILEQMPSNSTPFFHFHFEGNRLPIVRSRGPSSLVLYCSIASFILSIKNYLFFVIDVYVPKTNSIYLSIYLFLPLRKIQVNFLQTLRLTAKFLAGSKSLLLKYGWLCFNPTLRLYSIATSKEANNFWGNNSKNNCASLCDQFCK